MSADEQLPQIADNARTVREVVDASNPRLFFTPNDAEDETGLYNLLDQIIRQSVSEADRFGLRLDPNRPIETMDQTFLHNADISQVYNTARGLVLGYGVDIGMMVSIFNHNEARTPVGPDVDAIRIYIDEKCEENCMQIMLNARLYVLSPFKTWQQLRIWTRNRRFRCMDAMNWLTSHPLPFSLDLFARLTWDDEYLNHEEDELDYMLYKYHFHTRLCIANTFIRLLLLVCGTASFMTEEDARHMFKGRPFATQDDAVAFLVRMKDNILVYTTE